MSDIVQKYYKDIVKVHETWVTTEHSYRPSLIYLIESINTRVKAINEPTLTSAW